MLNDCILKNFVDLTLNEKKMVLSWRNNFKVKKWMYTNNDIDLNEHLAFIDSLKNNDSKKYFLVLNNNQYIGVIDFININEKSLEMGLYTNPDIKGVGGILLETIIKYSFEVLKTTKIFAEVFSENKKAYSLYKTFNFKEINEKNKNGQKVICMELKNENR